MVWLKKAPVGHAVAAGAGGVVAPAHTASVNNATGVHSERNNVAKNYIGVPIGLRDVAAQTND